MASTMDDDNEKKKKADDENEACCCFDAVGMIRLRRLNLRPYTEPELQWWIQSYVHNTIPDYQMAAWLMAVCCHGLSPENTATLTACMVQSGVRVAWSNNNSKKPLIDKHSTGGVGDKVSLILAPTAASLGVAVPMMAGRGLGHTGGTIDKLESIPGMRCSDLSVSEFQAICESATGCVIAAATPELCPADQKLYALRDVTDTVASLPLQTASIMSKKIAENPQSLVLGTYVFACTRSWVKRTIFCVCLKTCTHSCNLSLYNL